MNILKETHDTIVIEKTTKSGAFRRGVLLFLFGGLFILTGVFNIMKMIGTDDFHWGIFIIFPFAFIPFYFADKILNRMSLLQIVINKKEKTIAEIWGAPNRENDEDVKKYNDQCKVLLSKRMRHSKKGKQKRYYAIEVILDSTKENNTPDAIEVDSQINDYIEACYYAEHLAVFCGLALEDVSSGETVVNMPVDIVSRAALRMPDIPQDMQSLVKKNNENIVIEFPSYRMQSGCVMPLLLIGAWVVMWGVTFLEYLPENIDVQPQTRSFYLSLSGMIALGSVLMTLFMIIYFTRRRQRLIIEPALIQHEKYGILPKQTIKLPRYRIKEVDMDSITLMNQRAILIRSDRKSIKIGNTSMNEREREFIEGLLKTIFIL